MMFAIFSYVGSPNFTGDSTIRNKEGTRVIGVSDWREEMRKEIAQIEPKIAASSSELDKLPADDPGRAALTEKITDLKREVNGLTYATEGKARYPEALGPGGENMADMFNFNSDVDTGFKAFDAWINKLASKAKKNPELLLYKIQSNGYKFAWLLIPLSIPFVWLATLGKRGHRFYDHAVFTTYSIAFMSLLFIVVTLSVKFSIVPGIVIPAALFYAPFHMYRQLRHAYGTSRIGGMFRLALLLTCTTIVVTLFLTILVNLGLVG